MIGCFYKEKQIWEQRYVRILFNKCWGILFNKSYSIKERSALVKLPLMGWSTLPFSAKNEKKHSEELIWNFKLIKCKRFSLPSVQGINVHRMYSDLFPNHKEPWKFYSMERMSLTYGRETLRSMNFAFAQPGDGAVFLENWARFSLNFPFDL